MSTTVDRIRNEARALPPDEREALLTVLEFDLRADRPESEEDNAVESEWDAEIARRLNEVEEGKVELLTMEQVDRRLDVIRAKYSPAK